MRCIDCQFSKETIPEQLNYVYCSKFEKEVSVVTEFNKCQHDEKIINAFINGEWCDTNDICRLLKISFADGLKCFDFSRTAEWNAAPLEGQKITTKFRIKQNPEPPKAKEESENARYI